MDKIVAICGPTAVGKTEYSIAVAKGINGEIVSCDSMQLYKYMDIGSAKPTKEEMSSVRHHLVDMIDPREDFSCAKYCDLAKEAINSILGRGFTPVIEGGTGLYLNSLLYDMDFSNVSKNEKLREELEQEAKEYGAEYLHNKLQNLDPASASRIHKNNVKKVIRAIEGAMSGSNISDFKNCNNKTKDYDVILIGLTRNRDELYKRINKRVDIMVEKGIFDEVSGLIEMGLTDKDISMKGIGYKEIIGYFNNEYSKEEAIDLIKKNSRHFAKRQMTWFNRYDDIKWFNLSEKPDILIKSEIIDYISYKMREERLV